MHHDVMAARLSALADDTDALLEARRKGDRVVLATSGGCVDRSRRKARGGSLAAAVAGVLAAQYSPWGWLLAIGGLLALVVLPGRLRPARLLEIDLGRGLLIPCRHAAGATPDVTSVCLLRGVYETQGWDPRSVVYAVAEDDTATPVLILSGTDEKLAEQACRALGALLDRPATYAGPAGVVKSCYAGPEGFAHPA